MAVTSVTPLTSLPASTQYCMKVSVGSCDTSNNCCSALMANLYKIAIETGVCVGGEVGRTGVCVVCVGGHALYVGHLLFVNGDQRVPLLACMCAFAYVYACLCISAHVRVCLCVYD